MIHRRSTPETLAEPMPIVYDQARLQLIDSLRSNFPSWIGSEYVDYRDGWTRMGDYYAEGYFTREEMRELVHTRFGVKI